MPQTDVLSFAIPQGAPPTAVTAPGSIHTDASVDAPDPALSSHDYPDPDSPSSSLPISAYTPSPPSSRMSMRGGMEGTTVMAIDRPQLGQTASLGRNRELGQADGEATATATATATVKPQGGFPQYGSGPFGGRDSVAIPLLCIASLALAAGIVVFAAWRRMERRKTRREAKRDLSALKRSTLYVRA